MSEDRRKSTVKSASERLGAALDRLEDVLDAHPPEAGMSVAEASGLREDALAIAEEASVVVDQAVGELRVALAGLTAERGDSGDG